jgi:hypothetical protein
MKQIRPLVAYKKALPDLYKLYLTVFDGWEGLSKKAQENNFYWNYAYFEMKKGEMHPFFLKDGDNRNNKLTITELGRLLLTGWYYGIEEYTKEISLYVFNAYNKKVKEKEGFNDMEIYNLVKRIRENIGYYNSNKNEMKLFLLDGLFKTQLQELLPPPAKLKQHDETVDFLLEIRTNQKKKGIDFWVNKAESFEGYSYYLKELLEERELEFLTFEDWEIEFNKDGEGYSKEIDSLKKEYRKQLLNINLKKLL